ncbi:MAG TPA: prolipoprotein diacylglyceryl transferase [Candidatus Coproplasma stercoravium]|nr:prolipoprotein diacylglyceryl transferase [Candidatus Coproplasma stercoravium]
MYPYPLFSIGSVDIYAYGVCMAVGIIACFVFLLWTFWYKNFNEECTDKMLLVGIVATAIGILFAMLFQSLYNYIDTGEFSFGSMTFIGGLIGGVGSYLLFYNLYVYVVAPRAKHKWLQNHMNASLTDALPFIPIGITIAHAFGRLGCTFAGCCYGAAADWGIKFETTPGPVIPTQLFECIFLVLLSVVMAVLYFRFRFNCNFGLYSISYGIWRFVIEFFRDDNRGGFIPGLTPSQFWCIIMVILGIGYFFLYKYVLKKKMKHPELQPYVDPKRAKRAAEKNGGSEGGEE